MSEYIGSRISLISKSDIKYIGTLHEINSDTHTVALESVTSFGTEGRKGNPAEEIPGSDQVYEYIVFRGSDVKELTIVAPPSKEEERGRVPDDPAILGSARPTPQNQHPQSQQPQQPPNNAYQHQQYPGPPPQFQHQQPPFGYPGPPPPHHNQFPNQPPRFQGPGGPHGFPGTPGAVPGYGANFNQPPPPPPGCYGPPPGQGFPPGGPYPPNQHMQPGPPGQPMHQPQQIQGQMSQNGPPRPGSKQGTPQPGQGQPPPQAKPVEMPVSSITPATNVNAAPPPPPVDSKPTPAAAAAPAQPAARSAPKSNSRVAVPLPAGQRVAQKTATTTTQPAAAAAPPSVAAPVTSTQPHSTADATQAATAAVAAAMAKLGNPSQPGPQTGADNLTTQINAMRIQDQPPRQPWRNNGGPRGARGGGPVRGGGGGGRGDRRDNAPMPMPRDVEVPKEDFDFESANAKFNKQDLVKEAIASGSPLGSPIGGANGDPLAAAGMNGAKGVDGADEDVVIPPISNTGRSASGIAGTKGYDRQSSFFDDISSDLKDRVDAQAARDEVFASSGGGGRGRGNGNGGFVDGRAMRREERSKNVETFGVGSVDLGGRGGGYRGRGRGRGAGGFHHQHPRGGFGGGFRGGRGGFRGRGGPVGDGAVVSGGGEAALA